MHMSFYSKILFYSSLAVFAGCTVWREPSHEKPHVIVIAVESLNFENASCSDKGEEQEVFLEICKESMQFTHFYTPSTLSQPALATLLTGLDIAEHKVFHNGGEGIAAPVTTLAEKALQNGYHTAFFSGGPPILAKSGFQQGYEIFEDDFLRDDNVYIPVLDNLKRASNWLGNQNGPGFLTIYVPDMQFPLQTTYNDEGKERDKSTHSQMEEIAESLAWFFKDLKKKGLWDDAYIVILGLNGDPSPARKGVLWRESLFYDNVHVPLFLKTPAADAGGKSVDSLLTMKDIAHFLQRVVDSKTAEVDRVLQQLDEWSESPQTYVEIRSDWRNWWFGLAPEVSFRTIEYLVFPRQKMILYNSIADKNETIPLRESQASPGALKWLNTRYDESADKGAQVKNDLYEFLKYLHDEKQSRGSDFLSHMPGTGGVFTLLHADQALVTGDWRALDDTDRAIYKYVASKNLANDEAVTLVHACDKLFFEQKRAGLVRKCRDPLFLALLDWEKRRNAPDAAFWEKSFMRKYRFYMRYKRIAYTNLYLELNWDVDVMGLVGPSLAELYLSLPDKAALRKRVESYRIPLHVSFL